VCGIGFSSARMTGIVAFPMRSPNPWSWRLGDHIMGKNPAFQFYPSDWTRDLDDQDLEVEGAWIRVCCRLWWTEGKATKSIGEWSRILRKTQKKTMKIFQILIEKGIASGSLLDNQNITIISRRMVKDIEISKIRQEVGKKGGNPQLKKPETHLDNQTDNQNPTPSSSSSTTKKKNIAPSAGFDLFWSLYPVHREKKKAVIAWNKLHAENGTVEMILSALKNQIEWRKTAKGFIPEWPYPERWIKNERWTDEIEKTETAPSIINKGWQS